MNVRERIFIVLLWIAVIGMAAWFGGTLYQMLVIVPMWSPDPPESVRTFFLGTKYNETIWNFFGPPFMAARMLPIYGALIFGFVLAKHRLWLVIAALGMTFGLVFTLLYIYPINAVLFTQAGGGRGAEEVRSLVSSWIWADRLRFAVGCVSFLALLRALSLPVPRMHR